MCRPTSAKSLCTMSKTVKTVAGVYIVSFLFYSFNFMELHYVAVEVPSKISKHSVLACDDQTTSILGSYEQTVYSLYFILRVVLVHLIPCILLILFNAVLIHAMKGAAKRRSQLMKQNMRMESRRLEENNRTTMMLVTVVGIFLLVEVPLAVFLMAFLIMASRDETLALQDVISMILNFLILVTYPLNFFIYCRMSRQFRKSFKKMFECAGAGKLRSAPLKVSHVESKSQNMLESEGVEMTTYNNSKHNNDDNNDKNTCLLTIDDTTAVETIASLKE